MRKVTQMSPTLPWPSQPMQPIWRVTPLGTEMFHTILLSTEAVLTP